MTLIAQLVEQDGFLHALFEAIPCGVIVVDAQGRVQAVNDVVQRAFRGVDQAAIQKAAGDAIGCVHALQSEQGCGRTEHCENCQVRRAAQHALEGEQVIRSRAHMQLTVEGETHDSTLLVSAAPVDYQGQRMAIVILEDITELARLRRQLNAEHSFAGIVGRDPRMLALYDTIREVAEVNVPVLVQGESGTGKELVAAAIHSESPRAERPFIAVNCAALPDALLESELFGHVKGAFTGATRDRRGRFELAHRGAIFLDEVGDLSPAMQVKLLRVLQEGAFEPVGGEQTIHVDARIISATNKDLHEQIAAGRFREDLFYRLCTVPLTIPPLRERLGDIPLLTTHFIERTAEEWHRPAPALAPDALAALAECQWPGNVRQLQSAIQFAMVKCKEGDIELEHLPESVLADAQRAAPPRKPRRKKLNSKAVAEAIQQTGGNKARAAKALGVSRATLYRFLGEHAERAD